eukprot:TRINITY_DN7138_c1_g1_i1.p1 TRINITY_DN7138_c1_g1~~TRINITY_DN7138_c1_g1_i1.p1  ORF type:complete len:514 (+),score=54.13 TRINITY_DN7138_c1_g1_i1:106-1647(+)
MSSTRRSAAVPWSGGRTSSPPAPRQRSAAAAQAQPAPGVVSDSGRLGSARSSRRVDPSAASWSRQKPPSSPCVELRPAQIVNTVPVPGAQEPELPAVTCMAFDSTGEHFAYGDRSGRVHVCKRQGSLRPAGADGVPDTQDVQMGYRLIDVVDAHQKQLDTLNSLEIEPRVNVVRFMKRGAGAVYFITANDKTVKLFKVWEHARAEVDPSYDPTQALLTGWSTLKMPSVRQVDRGMWHKEVRVYSQDHEYDVNSVSMSSNCENFITSDDLAIYLWDIGHSECSLRVVDRKPANIHDLNEVITATTYHPTHPSEFCSVTCQGVLAVYDLRCAMRLATASQTFHTPQKSGEFLSSIANGYTHVQYSPCGNLMAARDYMSVSLWDKRSEAAPVQILPVHTHLKPRTTQLYETDCMFDKFEVAFNHSGQYVLSGSYRSEFAQFATDGSQSKLYQHMSCKPLDMPMCSSLRAHGCQPPSPDVPHQEADFRMKSLHIVAHPREDVVAVSNGSSVVLHSTD